MGKNPTDRGKNGSKRSLLVEADGGPLAVIVAAANVNDHLLLRETRTDDVKHAQTKNTTWVNEGITS